MPNQEGTTAPKTRKGRRRPPFADARAGTRDDVQALWREPHEVTRVLRLVQEELRSRRAAARPPFRSRSGSETEGRTRRILDAAPDAVIALDADGVISEWNKEAERLFGWSREQAVGRLASDTVITGPPRYPGGHEPAGILTPSAGPAPTPWIETTARRRDGREFPAEVLVSPIRTGRTAAMSLFVHDITERKREEERWRAARELERASRTMAMRELSASIAHEINQPLAAIVANVSACIRVLDSPSPDLGEVRQAVTDIARAGTRASEVVSRARAFLRSGVVNKTPFDINALVQETLVLPAIRAVLYHQPTSVRTELATGLPSVMGDRIQLQQVIFNLVINGIEAMAEVTDRPRVLRIRSQAHEEGGVLVAVQDSGVGLDPRDVERIFTAFVTTKPHGMGMGLSISRSIIEAHRGRLWAIPNVDRGATFQFALPAF